MVFGSVECTSRAQLDWADFYYCGSPGGFFGSRFRDGRPHPGPGSPKVPTARLHALFCSSSALPSLAACFSYTGATILSALIFSSTRCVDWASTRSVLERIIWRTSKAFVFGNPYNTVLATKPEAASCSQQALASSDALGDVAETDANSGASDLSYLRCRGVIECLRNNATDQPRTSVVPCAITKHLTASAADDLRPGQGSR